MKRLYSATQDERTRIVNRLAEALTRESNIAFAYVYGSFLDADSFHDVDIGVYVRDCEANQEVPMPWTLANVWPAAYLFRLMSAFLIMRPCLFSTMC